MPFLRNCWHIACWSEAVAAGDGIARTIMGLPILLHRRDTAPPSNRRGRR
ncbi:MAG TPA: hypothetical protein VFQ57_04730 [Sphingomonas sp.]|jgi:phenylpropionate dioxygenase-like ring-hydroxylating dioxygenase large terminal subunit|nr:hypothetical protein [Sphingomonas sp.]